MKYLWISTVLTACVVMCFNPAFTDTCSRQYTVIHHQIANGTVHFIYVFQQSSPGIIMCIACGFYRYGGPSSYILGPPWKLLLLRGSGVYFRLVNIHILTETLSAAEHRRLLASVQSLLIYHATCYLTPVNTGRVHRSRVPVHTTRIHG